MRSLWTDPAATHFPPLERDITVDIAIVGGGFSGLGAAHALSSTGAAVALLEARSIAAGASGRNAGFLLAGPAMPLNQAIDLLGEQEARAVWDFTIGNARRLATLIDDLEVDCGFLRRGSLSLAASPEEWTGMLDCLSCLQRGAIACCAVDRDLLPRPFHRLYHGGIYYGGNAELDPARFLRAVAATLPAPIQIHEGTPVRSLSHASSWAVRTPRSTVRANHLILATNAYTSTLLPDLPISPRRGQVLATAPLPRTIIPFPMYADHGYQYWRQTPEGRLVLGGWRNLDIGGEIGTDERLHPVIHATLDGFAAQILGSPPAVEHRWAGIMGFTPDSLPLVGPLPTHPDAWLAAGYSGHGVAMAFSCGTEVARAAIGRESRIPASFTPTRLLGR